MLLKHRPLRSFSSLGMFLQKEQEQRQRQQVCRAAGREIFFNEALIQRFQGLPAGEVLPVQNLPYLERGLLHSIKAAPVDHIGIRRVDQQGQ